jgi:hypothetical protein
MLAIPPLLWELSDVVNKTDDQMKESITNNIYP